MPQVRFEGRDPPSRRACLAGIADRPGMDPKLFALATALCFGLNPVTLKLGFARQGRTDVAVVIGLAVALPVYLALMAVVGGAQLQALTIPAVIAFILGGLFGGGIGRRWMFVAIDKLGAAPATAIKNSAPVITTALAVLILGQDVTLFDWLAILSIVLGITLVTWKKGATRAHFLSVGILAALGSAISYGIRPLFLEAGLEIANVPLTAALIGSVAALVWAFALTPKTELRTGLSGPSTALFAFSGILQAFGFLALTTGLSAGDVTLVYPVTSSAPLFTLGFSALLLRGTEQITWRIVVGSLLVVLGVIAL